MTQLLRHALSTEVQFEQGRVLARLVPYDISVRVTDQLPDGSFRSYDEGFRPGAFKRQVMSTERGVMRRVGLKHQHSEGMGYLGPLLSLDDRDDGLYGEFEVMPSKREDVAWLRSVGVDEISVEFVDTSGKPDDPNQDVQWRERAHLCGVALLPQGAYGSAGAAVLSMRDADELAAEQSQREAAAAAEAAAKAEAEAAKEAAKEAAAQAAAEEAAAKQRRQAEADQWVVEQERIQAELVAKYG